MGNSRAAAAAARAGTSTSARARYRRSHARAAAGGSCTTGKSRAVSTRLAGADRKGARAVSRATATPEVGGPAAAAASAEDGAASWSDEWFSGAYERCKTEDSSAGPLNSFRGRCRSALARARFPSRRDEVRPSRRRATLPRTRTASARPADRGARVPRPGARQSYRFTDLSQLVGSECSPPPPGSREGEELVGRAVEGAAAAEAGTLRLVIVDGIFRPGLSQMHGLDEGVFVGSSRSHNRDAARSVLSRAHGSVQGSLKVDTVFASLNGACAPDVVAVDVAPGVRAGHPLQVVYISTGADRGAGGALSTSFPRVSITVGAGASLSVLETFASAQDGAEDARAHFCCPVLEVSLAEGAELRHDYTQQSSRGAFHIRQTCVEQAERSTYNFTGVDTGSSLSRHNLFVGQGGRDTHTALHSFAMVSKDQLIDLHSDIDLDHPSGTTDQLHKCIVAHASSRGVFDGSVHVRKPAQQTDAGQLCRSLLLNRNATVNVKPNLQIHADDVKCTHGATISDLEEDQLFYLRSRGVSSEDARKTLVYSFGLEVVGRIGSESTRKRLAAVLADMCESDVS